MQYLPYMAIFVSQAVSYKSRTLLSTSVFRPPSSISATSLILKIRESWSLAQQLPPADSNIVVDSRDPYSRNPLLTSH